MKRKLLSGIKLSVSLVFLFAIIIAMMCSEGRAYAAEHSTPEVIDAKISLESGISLFFRVSAPEGVDYEDVRLLLSAEDCEPRIGESVDDFPEEYVTVLKPNGRVTVFGQEDYPYYTSFRSEPINPKELRRELHATPVVVSDGIMIAISESYSVSPFEIINVGFGASPTPLEIALNRAILDYGAAYQEVFCTPDEVEELGGWIDEYYSVYYLAMLDGKYTVYMLDGDAIRLRPKDFITAPFTYENGVFVGFSDKDKNPYLTYGETAASPRLRASDLGNPGLHPVVLNYSTAYGTQSNLDSLDKISYTDLSSAPFIPSPTATDKHYVTHSDSTLMLHTSDNIGHKGFLKNVQKNQGRVYVLDLTFTLETNYTVLDTTTPSPILTLALTGGISPNSLDELLTVGLVAGNGKLTVGDGIFNLEGTHKLHIEYESESIYNVILDGVKVMTGEADGSAFYSGVTLSTPQKLTTDRSTPNDVSITFTADDLFIGAVGEGSMGSFVEHTISFDNVTDLSTIAGGSGVKLNTSYAENGGGYATVVKDNADPARGSYLEVGRGSSANEIYCSVKNPITDAPDVWSVEFDFKLLDVDVRSSKSKDNWPVRIRFGGTTDSTAFTNLIIYYNSSTDRVHVNNVSFSAEEWIRIRVEYDVVAGKASAYMNGIEVATADYSSYDGKASAMPVIVFGTRGYSDSGADDLTTPDIVEETSVPRYSTVRMGIDNVVIGAYYGNSDS